MAKAARTPSDRYVLQIIEGPDAGKTFPIVKAKISIGRTSQNDLALSDPSVSSRHAVIAITPEGCLVQDARSRHGTKVNDQPTTGATRLENGDQIALGATKLVLRMLPAAKPPAPAEEEEPPAAEPEGEMVLSEEELGIGDIDLDGVPDAGEGGGAIDFIKGEGKPILPFVVPGVVIMLILAFGGYKLATHEGGWGVRRGPRNFLRPNHSFDESVAQDGMPLGWHTAGQGYTWSLSDHAETGKYAAAKSQANAVSGELVRAKGIAVEDHVGYAVSGMIKASGCQGVAAIKVRWTSAEHPGFVFDQFTNVISSDSDWATVSRSLPVPGPFVTTLTVSCAVFGPVGSVGFDELKLNDSTGLQESPRHFAVDDASGHITIKACTRGVLSVICDRSPLLWNGEVTLGPDALLGYGRQALSAPARGHPRVDDETNSIVFAGRMTLPEANQPLDLVQRLSPKQEGIVIDYALKPTKPADQIVPGVAFCVDPARLPDGATVMANSTYVSQTEPFEMDAVEEISWGEAESRVILTFEQPGKLKYQVVDGRHMVAYSLEPQAVTAGKEVALQITIGNVSVKKDKIFEEAITKVRELASDGKWSKALAAAEPLLKMSVFSDDQRAEVQKEIDGVVAKVGERAEELRGDLRRGEEAQSVEDLMKVEAAIADLMKLVKGTRCEPAAHQLEKDLAAANQRLAAAFEAAAQRFMDRVEVHRKRGEFIIARIYIENIMRQYPRTEVAKRAAADMRQIQTLIAKAEEKAKFIKSRMEEAANAERIDFWRKAKEAYKAIIDRYPDSPEAAEAEQKTKALDETIRKHKEGG